MELIEKYERDKSFKLCICCKHYNDGMCCSKGKEFECVSFNEYFNRYHRSDKHLIKIDGNKVDINHETLKELKEIIIRSIIFEDINYMIQEDLRSVIRLISRVLGEKQND